jgi:hypothetical protein
LLICFNSNRLWFPAGKKDMLNGVLGGVAAGGVLGTALGRMPVGVGAAALLAATSMTVDLSGHSLKVCMKWQAGRCSGLAQGCACCAVDGL